MINWFSKYHIVIFLLSTGIYLQTTSFDFVLDDKIVITGNQITKRGFEGVPLHFKHDAMDGFWAEQYNVQVEDYETRGLVSGGRYRPLALSSHALEYALFGENAAIGHFINAVLYGLLCLILYTILLRFFPSYKEGWLSIPFVLSVLYAMHPLHVEVVANIKGRDEILSFLFAAIPMAMILKNEFTVFSKKYWIAIGLFFLSLLSKETSIAFVALIPLAYFYKGNSAKKSLILGAGFLGVSLVYLFIRMQVIGSTSSEPVSELMNNPFVNASKVEQWAVIFLTFFAYLKLMLIPTPLTHDYYPYHLPFMGAESAYPSMGHWASLLGLLCLVILLVLMFKGAMKKQSWSYGIWFFFGTIVLVSNAIFPVGVFMNERFMFIPSFGLLIAAVGLIERTRNKEVVSYGLLALSVVFAVLSVKRSFAWETDETLTLTDIQTSTRSAKGNMAAGNAYLKLAKEADSKAQKQEYLNKSFAHLKSSLEIHPTYFDPMDLLGNVYFESGNYIESAKFFKRCALRKPEKPNFLNNIVIVGNKLIEEQRFQDANTVYDMALEVNPYHLQALRKIAEVQGRYLNNLDKSLEYLKKAEQIAPNDESILQNIGVANAVKGNSAEAIQYFEKTLRINPNNSSVLQNLGIIYINMGEESKGNQYLLRAQEVKQ